MKYPELSSHEGLDVTDLSRSQKITSHINEVMSASWVFDWTCYSYFKSIPQPFSSLFAPLQSKPHQNTHFAVFTYQAAALRWPFLTQFAGVARTSILALADYSTPCCLLDPVDFSSVGKAAALVLPLAKQQLRSCSISIPGQAGRPSPCGGCSPTPRLIARAFCPLVLLSAVQGTHPSSPGCFFWEQKCSSAGVYCISNAYTQPSYQQLAFWGEGLLIKIE